MQKKVFFVAMVSLLSVPSMSMASPCTEGEQNQHQLLKACKIKNATDAVSGNKLPNVEVCLSRIEKSGGPFGGDTIPWYYSHFKIENESGEVLQYVFNSPNGRHNFRSLIDYSVVELIDSQFYMESHRTKYPDNSRKGTIDLHVVSFDTNTQILNFDYSKRLGVMFGRWEDKLSFEAHCQE